MKFIHPPPVSWREKGTFHPYTLSSTMTSGPDMDSRELSTYAKNTPTLSSKKSGSEIFVFLAIVISKTLNKYISKSVWSFLGCSFENSKYMNFHYYVNIVVIGGGIKGESKKYSLPIYKGTSLLPVLWDSLTYLCVILFLLHNEDLLTCNEFFYVFTLALNSWRLYFCPWSFLKKIWWSLN